MVVRRPSCPCQGDNTDRFVHAGILIVLAGGVANYLGTYWPVGDAGAAAFADAFYTGLLRGDPLGRALIDGRAKVRERNLGDWANYVLYGNPEFRLAPG